MKKVQISFFAGLKDFYGDSMYVELPLGYSKDDVLSVLNQRNSEAIPLLEHSRFATEHEFLDMDAVMDATQLFILPPSSGG